jgi:nitroreductase
MDVLQAIFTRRSIRKFTGEPISEEAMDTILKAGFSAPSAHNYQPWHFVIVREKETLEHIADKHSYAKMLPQAGCCIIVCGDNEKQKREGFIVEDCSAAIQNILLAAHGIGLGAVWCGIYPVEEYMKMIADAIKLPDNTKPIGMVVIGHKLEDREPVDKYDKAKVHYEKW